MIPVLGLHPHMYKTNSAISYKQCKLFFDSSVTLVMHLCLVYGNLVCVGCGWFDFGFFVVFLPII